MRQAFLPSNKDGFFERLLVQFVLQSSPREVPAHDDEVDVTPAASPREPNLASGLTRLKYANPRSCRAA